MRPCSADVFVVAQRASDKLRVWSGSQLSRLSADVFHPRWLADPSALVVLEASWDIPLCLSTRNGACFYDQLRAPRELIKHFGRPQLKVSELTAAGISARELNAFVIDGAGGLLRDNDWVTPVNLTWPMGFAHSSCIAQQVMTSACLAAVFKEGQFITTAGALPQQSCPVVAVATDDINCFVRVPRHQPLDGVEPPRKRLC